jgi:hypothetical protein
VEDTPAAPAGDLTDLAWALRRVAVERSGVVDLFPAPFPPTWRGGAIEAHRVPVAGGMVSAALRWHGARPALLWEADAPVELRCSGLDRSWSTSAPRGEVLLAHSG